MVSACRTDEIYQPWRPEFRGRSPLITDGEYQSQQYRFVLETAGGKQIKLIGNKPDFPQELRDALTQVAELDEMEPGWDGYNSLAVSDRAIEGALSLVLSSFALCSFPRAHMSNDGGVDLFWSSESRKLEITVRSDERCEALYSDDLGETIEYDDPVTIDVAKKLISKYCAHR